MNSSINIVRKVNLSTMQFYKDICNNITKNNLVI